VSSTSNAPRERILVVEDEPDLRSLLDRSLEEAGYRVSLAEDGIEALEKAATEPLDLILLDLMIPHIDGIEVCRRLKRDARTARLPVIMLTARQEPVDRIAGLELGADDYVTKPFNLRELVLRVGAVLSRSRGERGRSAILGDAGLRLDPTARVVTVDDREVQLTGREFDLLHFLLSHPNRVLSRSELLRQVWEYDFDGFDRTVDSHVARLRKKLGPPGDWIETAWGIGYSYRPPSG
jgi:two-component system phosphate regulon response regulator PhoB